MATKWSNDCCGRSLFLSPLIEPRRRAAVFRHPPTGATASMTEHDGNDAIDGAARTEPGAFTQPAESQCDERRR